MPVTYEKITDRWNTFPEDKKKQYLKLIVEFLLSPLFTYTLKFVIYITATCVAIHTLYYYSL